MNSIDYSGIEHQKKQVIILKKLQKDQILIANYFKTIRIISRANPSQLKPLLIKFLLTHLILKYIVDNIVFDKDI